MSIRLTCYFCLNKNDCYWGIADFGDDACSSVKVNDEWKEIIEHGITQANPIEMKKRNSYYKPKKKELGGYLVPKEFKKAIDEIEKKEGDHGK